MIRRAKESDIPKILDLLLQVNDVHAAIRPDVFIPGKTKYSPDELIPKLADENTPVFVASEGGKVVGYAFCVYREQSGANLVPGKTLYIDDLCVDASERGKGTGEKLYRHVLQTAKENGCVGVTLYVWEGNDRAKRFYEKMGLVPRATTLEYKLK